MLYIIRLELGIPVLRRDSSVLVPTRRQMGYKQRTDANRAGRPLSNSHAKIPASQDKEVRVKKRERVMPAKDANKRERGRECSVCSFRSLSEIDFRSRLSLDGRSIRFALSPSPCLSIPPLLSWLSIVISSRSWISRVLPYGRILQQALRDKKTIKGKSMVNDG